MFTVYETPRIRISAYTNLHLYEPLLHQHNDTEHNGTQFDYAVSLIVMLSDVMLCRYAECHYAECRYAKCCVALQLIYQTRHLQNFLLTV